MREDAAPKMQYAFCSDIAAAAIGSLILSQASPKKLSAAVQRINLSFDFRVATSVGVTSRAIPSTTLGATKFAATSEARNNCSFALVLNCKSTMACMKVSPKTFDSPKSFANAARYQRQADS